MEFFFKPKGIALIGASANPNKGGFSILTNLMTGYKGAIYPVNPRYNDIRGLRCYRSVLEVPDPLDLAIVFVPAEATLGAVQDCAERGVPGVMIQSAGFAESGDLQGRRLQDDLKQIRQKTGMRLWGPNCMGLVDAVHGQVYSFVAPSIWDEGLMAGKVSLIVQSGMLTAGFLIDLMTHGIMGISKACSIGNKVDVDECDLLQYLIDDRDTETICLYLESIQNGKRFLEICRRSNKPIVALKGGKSEKGAQAAMSHTASIAGNRAVVSAAFAQVGVAEANDFMQLMDLGRTLCMYPDVNSPSTCRVAVLTFSGAAGIVSSDFIEHQGLELADLSENTKDDLKEIFPEWMPVSNPVDLWPAIERNGPEIAWGRAFKAVCADPNVDAVFFHVFVGGFSGKTDISSLVKIARTADKPVFGWLLGKRTEARDFLIQANEMGVPVFREIQRAVECMAAVFKRSNYLQRRNNT